MAHITKRRHSFPRQKWVKGMMGCLATTIFLATSPLTSAKHIEASSSPTDFFQNIDAFVVPADIGPSDTWLHIDLQGRRLIVLRGGERLDKISYVAYGSSGYRRVRVQGSRQTPVGEFTIQRLNPHSKFRTFMEFDYPTPSTAWAAYTAGLLSDAEYLNYEDYRIQHGRSPQNTRLGGHIGLHGLGSSDEWIHKQRDWTEGCIAVTNEEIDRITRWIGVGSKIIVRG